MAFRLPLSLKSVNALIGDADAESLLPCKLELLVDKTVSASCKAAARLAFMPDAPNLDLSLAAYGDEPTDTAEYADLTVILAGRSPHTAALMLSAALRRRSVVIVAEDVRALAEAWPSQALPIDASRLVAVTASQPDDDVYGRLFANLARWMLNEQPQSQMAWARSLGFVRQAYAADLLSSTALTNGVVALAVFLPGADLPVLLINQARMYMRLAAVLGLPLEARRYGEIAVIGLAGYGWRGLARRLTAWMPGFGWAVKATIGYVGTWAIGVAAIAYLATASIRLRSSGEADGGEANGASPQGAGPDSMPSARLPSHLPKDTT
jgi:uncharacterized protein (DUF697 family)